MEFIRRTTGYTRLDYKNNLDIIKERNTQPVTGFIESYRSEENEVPRISHSRTSSSSSSRPPHGGLHENAIRNSHLLTERTKVFGKTLQIMSS
jgi:hypothetical protein